jgi:integrase
VFEIACPLTTVAGSFAFFFDKATLVLYRSQPWRLVSFPTVETVMTPSIVKNLVRMPRQRAKQVRARISYMTPEQLDRFLRAAKEYGPREHAMFLFAVAHGARAQEICNLKLSDINFSNEQIHVARLKGSLDSTQTLLRVKGNSLFDEKAALKAWLAIRRPDAGDSVFNIWTSGDRAECCNRVTEFVDGR